MDHEDESCQCHSASNRVLALPEIRAAVFEQLGQGSLASAARVCRAWMEQALSALWCALCYAWYEPHTFLGPNIPRRRRAFYSAYIRHLQVDELEELQLDNWTFPNLRSLSISFNPVGYTAATTRTIIDALARCGPQLSTFRFSVTEDTCGHDIDGIILCYLAHRPGLRRLTFDLKYSGLTTESSEAVFRTKPERPFMTLERLEARVSDDALPSLMALCTGEGMHTLPLQSLQLSLSKCTGQFFHLLAPLQHSLRELFIEAYSDIEQAFLGTKDLHLLQTFVHLRILQIKPFWKAQYDVNGHDPLSITDADIVLVVGRMRHLHTLMLDFDCLFSDRLFEQLGLHSPQLVRLRLRAHLMYDSLSSSSHAALYPWLEELGMDSSETASKRYDFLPT